MKLKIKALFTCPWNTLHALASPSPLFSLTAKFSCFCPSEPPFPSTNFLFCKLLWNYVLVCKWSRRTFRRTKSSFALKPGLTCFVYHLYWLDFPVLCFLFVYWLGFLVAFLYVYWLVFLFYIIYICVLCFSKLSITCVKPDLPRPQGTHRGQACLCNSLYCENCILFLYACILYFEK